VLDTVRGARIRGEHDNQTYQLGLPPVALEWVAATQGAGSHVTISMDGRVIRIEGVNGATSIAAAPFDRPDFEGVLPTDEAIGAWARITGRDLYSLAIAGTRARVALEEMPPGSPVWLGIADGQVHVETEEDVRGPAVYSFRCDEVTGGLYCQIDAKLLVSLLQTYEPDDSLLLGIPTYASDPILVRGELADSILMPITPPKVVLRRNVEAIITEVCGRLATTRDADGDYPLEFRKSPVYARLLTEDGPATLQVFAVLLTGIEPTVELLRELNELNGSMTYARLFHTGEVVMAEVDLAADTLDAHELRVAIDRISEEARKVMSTLALVFGGETVGEQLAPRLALYRGTIIEAELAPRYTAILTGPDAVQDWPFKGVVHVITGWNPHGVELENDRADSVNEQIATDVIRHGGRFVDGVGRSVSGDHAERSVIAWGLKRADAAVMGDKASQDAIFEIDEDTVRLVSCEGEVLESWPRRGS
jgi:hypothetical protein